MHFLTYRGNNDNLSGFRCSSSPSQRSREELTDSIALNVPRISNPSPRF